MQAPHTRSDENVPAGPPPPGVTPNFTNPVSRASTVVATNIIFMVISTTALCMRLYTRRFILNMLNLPDYFIIAGHLLAAGFSVFTMLIAINHGQALHVWDIPLSRVGYIMKMSLVQSSFLWLAITFAKLSILTFYLGLSPYQYFRLSIYLLMAVVASCGLLSTFYFLFACNPIEKYWDITNPHGSCIDLETFWYTSAAVNSATDFIILVVPVLMLWPAPIPVRQKIGVLAIFMVGGLVCITSVLRVYHLAALRDEPDRSWPLAPTIWGVIEIHLGLTCGNLPHLKPLVRHILHFMPMRNRKSRRIHRSGSILSQGTPMSLLSRDLNAISDSSSLG